MHGYVERMEWYTRTLLSLEHPFVIRHPPELREALRVLAAVAAALAERA